MLPVKRLCVLLRRVSPLGWVFSEMGAHVRWTGVGHRRVLGIVCVFGFVFVGIYLGGLGLVRLLSHRCVG
jgi:hypothetical protein